MEWRNGTSSSLNDLEALVTIAFEAKEWIATHTLKTLRVFRGSLRPSGGFPLFQNIF